ncbi:hypothetical protein SY88_23785 [Clostridiales bacterium PH28_bin88]|nr:hypothetical protein SY88_23785 [Clostridiales bacterium PH28_bin88]
MKEDKLILYNNDGTETTLVNPFGPMKALYDELRKDPNAVPELSDESRAAILAEIEKGAIEDRKPMEAAYLGSKPNRHERRRAAALARKRMREEKRMR